MPFRRRRPVGSEPVKDGRESTARHGHQLVDLKRYERILGKQGVVRAQGLQTGQFQGDVDGGKGLRGNHEQGARRVDGACRPLRLSDIRFGLGEDIQARTLFAGPRPFRSSGSVRELVVTKRPDRYREVPKRALCRDARTIGAGACRSGRLRRCTRRRDALFPRPSPGHVDVHSVPDRDVVVDAPMQQQFAFDQGADRIGGPCTCDAAGRYGGLQGLSAQFSPFAVRPQLQQACRGRASRSTSFSVLLRALSVSIQRRCVPPTPMSERMASVNSA